eukprot:GILK01006702.1.p1 GENE.GILK01006702.1~~GILK01006702.1.p1  ORF type:complete len:678 (+),score=91.31 GILK01006702.1:304-2034(+)
MSNAQLKAATAPNLKSGAVRQHMQWHTEIDDNDKTCVWYTRMASGYKYVDVGGECVGFDRGHMAPFHDFAFFTSTSKKVALGDGWRDLARRWAEAMQTNPTAIKKFKPTELASLRSFLPAYNSFQLSNQVPQEKSDNAGYWKNSVEKALRINLLKKLQKFSSGGTAYIITGVLWYGNTNRAPIKTKFVTSAGNDAEVVVPRNLFKIAYILPNGFVQRNGPKRQKVPAVIRPILAVDIMLGRPCYETDMKPKEAAAELASSHLPHLRTNLLELSATTGNAGDIKPHQLAQLLKAVIRQFPSSSGLTAIPDEQIIKAFSDLMKQKSSMLSQATSDHATRTNPPKPRKCRGGNWFRSRHIVNQDSVPKCQLLHSMYAAYQLFHKSNTDLFAHQKFLDQLPDKLIAIMKTVLLMAPELHSPEAKVLNRVRSELEKWAKEYKTHAATAGSHAATADPHAATAQKSIVVEMEPTAEESTFDAASDSLCGEESDPVAEPVEMHLEGSQDAQLAHSPVSCNTEQLLLYLENRRFPLPLHSFGRTELDVDGLEYSDAAYDCSEFIRAVNTEFENLQVELADAYDP